MADKSYRADLVNPNRTAAMEIYRLAFMDGGLGKRPHHSFNIVRLGTDYRVQAGYADNDKFNLVGETTSIPLPAGWDLTKVAQEELRLPGNAATVFLNGRLHSRAGSTQG